MALCGACTVHLDGNQSLLVTPVPRSLGKDHHHRSDRGDAGRQEVQQAWLDSSRAVRVLPVGQSCPGVGAGGEERPSSDADIDGHVRATSAARDLLAIRAAISGRERSLTMTTQPYRERDFVVVLTSARRRAAARLPDR